MLGSCDSLNPANDKVDDPFETIHDDLVIVTTNNDSLSLTNTASDTAYYLLFNPCALVSWDFCATPDECQSLGMAIAPNAIRQFAFSEAQMWSEESPCVAVAYWYFAMDGPAPSPYRREHETIVDIFIPENP